LWVAKLIESGRERKDQRALSLGHWALGWIEIFAGDYAGAARNSEEALKAAVTPYDQNAASHVKAVALLLQGRFEEGRERLLVIRQWALDNGWLYFASGTNLFIAPALALGGDLRSAIALLKTSIKTADANGNRTIASWCRIILAELYLGVVTRASRPPLRVILRNIATILNIALFGGRRARSLLVEAKSNEQFAEFGTTCARIELDLGKLAHNAKRPGDARSHFARARAAAEAQSATIIVGEIDAASATLE
jgi:tetratricopeptide (TPR) repeat protein